MAEKTLPSVRDHATALMADMVKEGKISPDADAATLAAGIPTFSKGTVTLDENTGQPVHPRGKAPKTPEFSEGGVAIPEGEQAAGPIAGAPAEPSPEVGTVPGKTAEQLITEHQAFIAGAVAPPEDKGAPAVQEAGSQAAEAAAQAVVDAFADYEEFEVEDPDLELKYPVRVPKNFAPSAKNGYKRRATYDRTVSYLKNADPVLRQMIEDGRINRVLPLIQAAIENDAYGNYVAQGYDRMQRGLPLIEQARQEGATAGAPTPEPGFDHDAEDPFFAERVKPLVAKYESLEQKFTALEQRDQTAAERARQQQQEQTRTANAMQDAHKDLDRMFPGHVRLDLGAQDPFWQKAVQQTREGGYADAYGIRAGIVFGGQVAMKNESERLAATSSPTATALQQAEQKHGELARTQAIAASRTVGGGAPTQSAPPPPVQKPSTKNPDGTMKPPGQYLREQQAYMAAQGQPA